MTHFSPPTRLELTLTPDPSAIDDRLGPRRHVQPVEQLTQSDEPNLESSSSPCRPISLRPSRAHLRPPTLNKISLLPADPLPNPRLTPFPSSPPLRRSLNHNPARYTNSHPHGHHSHHIKRPRRHGRDGPHLSRSRPRALEGGVTSVGSGASRVPLSWQLRQLRRTMMVGGTLRPRWTSLHPLLFRAQSLRLHRPQLGLASPEHRPWTCSPTSSLTST